MVLVEAAAAGKTGLGWSYASPAAATLIRGQLADEVAGCDAMDIPRAWETMIRSIRNQGRPGVGSMAVAAVDIALWDLKARLFDVSLVSLLGGARDSVPIYGSG